MAGSLPTSLKTVREVGAAAVDYLRVVGRQLEMDVRNQGGGAGGYATPTPLTPALTRMELAAYADDSAGFEAARREAVEKAKALEYIYRISDVNKNIFAFNSENGTIPVYTKNFTTLLKEEVEGKANSQAWYNLGAEYGVWAALKRQGAAETLTKCKHHELLMPIPQSELNANPNIKQNTGY